MKVGDRVLGYWEETMDWYPGRVTCVKLVRGRYSFEVDYDPGEDGASDTSTNSREGVRHLLQTGDEAADFYGGTWVVSRFIDEPGESLKYHCTRKTSGTRRSFSPVSEKKPAALYLPADRTDATLAPRRAKQRSDDRAIRAKQRQQKAKRQSASMPGDGTPNRDRKKKKSNVAGTGGSRRGGKAAKKRKDQASSSDDTERSKRSRTSGSGGAAMASVGHGRGTTLLVNKWAWVRARSCCRGSTHERGTGQPSVRRDLVSSY